LRAGVWAIDVRGEPRRSLVQAVDRDAVSHDGGNVTRDVFASMRDEILLDVEGEARARLADTSTKSGLAYELYLQNTRKRGSYEKATLGARHILDAGRRIAGACPQVPFPGGLFCMLSPSQAVQLFHEGTFGVKSMSVCGVDVVVNPPVASEFRIPVYLVWDRDGRQGRVGGGVHEMDRKLARAGGKEFRGRLEGTTIEDGFSCVEDNLTPALSRDLQGCKDLIGEGVEYGGLRKAVEQDAESTLQAGKKCRKCGEPQGTPAGHKVLHRAQKDFLNNKSNVLEMLRVVRRDAPERLEAFTTARIVRRIEKAGVAAMADHVQKAEHSHDAG